MTKRGAPRLAEREDPLSFVLRNRPAREVLERLRGEPLMIPITIRKAVGVHPETFRRIVSELDDFKLISIRALPRVHSKHGQRVISLRWPAGIELTRQGEAVLDLTSGVRGWVRRHSRLLPDSSAKHWLAVEPESPVVDPGKRP